MRVELNYDDETDSDNKSEEETKEKPNPDESFPSLQELKGSASSYLETAPDNASMHSDDSSVSNNSLLGTTNPVTALTEEDSWQFDLGVMENKNKRVEEQALMTSTFHERETNDYDDAMSKVSMMSEELTVISHEIEQVDRAMKSLLLGKETEIKEFRRNPLRRTKSSDHALPGVLTPEFLAQRKQDRAKRLQKARERITRDREMLRENAKQEGKRRKEEEAKTKILDMSQDARRDRAYQWYSRCGQPNRKELKKRIAFLKHKQGVSTDDVDLLPWNFNGSMINVSKMQEYQLAN